MRPDFNITPKGKIVLKKSEGEPINPQAPDVKDGVTVLTLMIKNRGPYGDAVRYLLQQAFNLGRLYEQKVSSAKKST